MKTSKQCPKCESRRIRYLENTYDYNTDDSAQLHAPEPVGVVPKEGWLFTKNIPTGQLEAYLCGDCGYYETYIKNVADLPLEKLLGFRWVNSDEVEAGPYL